MTTRIPLEAARHRAEEFIRIAELACTRIEIAGSIRRKALMVKDIEIVAVPKISLTQPGLFSGVAGIARNNLLNEAVDGLLQQGRLKPRLDKNGRPALGDKYKRLIFDEMPLDLFIVTPPQQFGAIMAIRTGPAEFSHRCMMSRLQGGAMPPGCRQQDGALWLGSTMLETPEEEDWFEMLNLPTWPAEERSEASLIAHLKGSKQ